MLVDIAPPSQLAFECHPVQLHHPIPSSLPPPTISTDSTLSHPLISTNSTQPSYLHGSPMTPPSSLFCLTLSYPPSTYTCFQVGGPQKSDESWHMHAFWWQFSMQSHTCVNSRLTTNLKTGDSNCHPFTLGVPSTSAFFAWQQLVFISLPSPWGLLAECKQVHTLFPFTVGIRDRPRQEAKALSSLSSHNWEEL
jgi:hypothetical protein